MLGNLRAGQTKKFATTGLPTTCPRSKSDRVCISLLKKLCLNTMQQCHTRNDVDDKFNKRHEHKLLIHY